MIITKIAGVLPPAQHKKTEESEREQRVPSQLSGESPKLDDGPMTPGAPASQPHEPHQLGVMLLDAEMNAARESDYDMFSPIRNRRDGDATTKSTDTTMQIHKTNHQTQPCSACTGDISNPVTKPMFGKPVLYRDAKTVLTMNAEKFGHKLLCHRITLNPGDSCAFSCSYCYVPAQMLKVVHPTKVAAEKALGRSLDSSDVVIRRSRTLKTLKSQLMRPDGSRRFDDPGDQRVVFCSSTVDPAATKELLKETAALCNCILENTSWHIRLLSKSALLAKLVTDNLIDPKYHHRLIFGFSIGTLDDEIARVVEVHTSSPMARLKALHELQDLGIRTFGMICPSLPQADYDGFSKSICAAIRVDRCEHVWAEVMNVRGASLTRTTDALRDGGFHEEADRLEAVSGARNSENWEAYARATFLAHARHIPPRKLRFLQYIDWDTADWWAKQRRHGAVLIGKAAEELGLLATDNNKAAPKQARAGLKGR